MRPLTLSLFAQPADDGARPSAASLPSSSSFGSALGKKTLSLSCCIEHTRDGGEEGQFVISSDCFHQSPLGCPRGILKAKFFPSSSEVLLSMMFTYDFYHFCAGDGRQNEW